MPSSAYAPAYAAGGDSEILRTTTQARAEKAVCDGVGATLNSFGTKDQSATAMQVEDVVSAAAACRERMIYYPKILSAHLIGRTRSQ